MADRLDFLIDSNPEKFLRGLNSSVKRAEAFDKSLERLTGGQIRFNAASGQFTNASGEFVRRTEVRRIALERMAEAGDKAGESLGGMGSKAHKANPAVRQLGFIVNDLQSFSLGASAGMRAISNNLGMLAIGLGASGAVVLGIELAGTALALFGDQLLRAKKETEELTKELDGLLDSMLNFATGPRLEVDPKSLPGFMAAISRRMKELGGEDLQKLRELRKEFSEIETTMRGSGQGGGTVPQSLLDRRKEVLEEIAVLTERTAGVDNERVDTLQRVLDKAAETRLVHLDEERIYQDLIDAGATRKEAEEKIKEFTLEQGEALKHQLSLQEQITRERIEELRVANRLARIGAMGVRREGFRSDQEEIRRRSPGVADFGELPEETLELRDNMLQVADATEIAAQGFGHFADAAQMAFDATGKRNSAFFGAFKAFAIASAIINTYQGATKAIAEGGVAGPFLAAGIVLSGMAYVAKMLATEPGSTSVSGGVASRFGGIADRAANAPAYAAGGSPPDRIVIEMTPVLRGEDIFWMQQRVQQRHSLAGRR